MLEDTVCRLVNVVTEARVGCPGTTEREAFLIQTRLGLSKKASWRRELCLPQPKFLKYPVLNN